MIKWARSDNITVKITENAEVRKDWQHVKYQHRIFISKEDLFNLTDEDECFANININDKPYPVASSIHLCKGEIMIPEVYESDLGSTQTFQLSKITKDPLILTAVIANVESQQNERLRLDKDMLKRLISKIVRDEFVIITGKKYPIYVLHDIEGRKLKTHDSSIDFKDKNGSGSCDTQTQSSQSQPQTSASLPLGDADSDIPVKEAKDCEWQKVWVSFTPTHASVQDLLNSKKVTIKSKFNENKISNLDNFIVSMPLNLFFSGTANKLFKPEPTTPRLMGAKAIDFTVDSHYNGDNKVFMSGNLLRSMQTDPNAMDTRFLVKINNYYFYTGAYNKWGKGTPHKLTAIVNTSFFRTFGTEDDVDFSKQDIDFSKQVEKKITPAEKIVIHLNWLDGLRTKLSLSREQLITFVREALKDVLPAKGLMFQVPLLLSGSAEKKRFILEARVIEITGSPDDTGIRSSSAESDPEPLFNCTAASTVQLSAEDHCILDGSEPDATSEYVCKRLTSGLVAMDKYAREIYQKVILSRQDYEEEKHNTYNRGVLLYGLPGNGKSTLATNLFHALKSNNKISIQSEKLIEETPEKTINNLEEKFSDAREDHNRFRSKPGSPVHKAPLHVFLIDEIDGLFRKNDGDSDFNIAINTYLKKLLSSSEQLNNIIIIGTINSSSSQFDRALIREGLFSTHINIDNPEKEDRQTLMEFFLSKAKTPVAFMDQNTAQLAAAITGHQSSVSIKSFINDVVKICVNDTNKNADKDKALQGGKSPGNIPSLPSETKEFKIETNHIFSALHPEEEVKQGKKDFLKKLKDLSLTDRHSVFLKSEEESMTELNKSLDRLTTLGRHRLIFIEGSKNSRLYGFCHDLLKPCKRFYSYHIANTDDETLIHLALSRQSHKTVILFHNINALFDSPYPSLSDTIREIGMQWELIKKSETTSTAFIILIPENYSIETVKLLLGIDCNYYDSVTLQDKFDQKQMKEFLRSTYPKASEQAINDVIKPFGQNFFINEFVELTKLYHVQKGNSSAWDLDGIDHDLSIVNTNHSDPMYT